LKDFLLEKEDPNDPFAAKCITQLIKDPLPKDHDPESPPEPTYTRKIVIGFDNDKDVPLYRNQDYLNIQYREDAALFECKVMRLNERAEKVVKVRVSITDKYSKEAHEYWKRGDQYPEGGSSSSIKISLKSTSCSFSSLSINFFFFKKTVLLFL